MSEVDALRLAYADPPYLGMGKLYAEHHEEAWLWDDPDSHRNLIAQLNDGFDGWALSLSVPSLQVLLPMCPPGVRIASWVKPFAAFKRNVRIAYTWEPVIFKPARDSSKLGAMVGRDHLSEPITMKRGLTGAKPERFCSWVLDLMGWVSGDYVDDLFPGTGVMSRVVRQRELQPTLDAAVIDQTSLRLFAEAVTE